MEPREERQAREATRGVQSDSVNEQRHGVSRGSSWIPTSRAPDARAYFLVRAITRTDTMKRATSDYLSS